METSSSRTTKPEHPPRPRVRLAERDLEGIRAAAAQVLGDRPGIRLWLHGSRVEPDRRGGDIDLLITCRGGVPADRLRLTRRLLIALEDRLGERQVDVAWADEDRPDAFAARVLPRAVELWRTAA